MKIRLIAILLLLFTTFVQAQQGAMDSLRKVVTKTNDPLSLYYLSMLLDQSGKTDSALMLISRAVSYSTDAGTEAFVRVNYCDIATRHGLYALAQQNAFKALHHYTKINDSSFVAVIYGKLGMIAHITSAMDKSVEYYEKGLLFDPRNLTLKNDLGSTLLEQNISLFKAVSIYQELLATNPRLRQSAIYNNNLGDAFLRLGEYDSALKHINATLKISHQLKDSAGLMFDSNLLGRYYLSQGQLVKAKSCFYFALGLGTKFGERENLWIAAELPVLFNSLTNIYQKEGRLDSVIYFKSQYISFLGKQLQEQKKSTSEFAFAASEDDFKNFLQSEKQNRVSRIQYLGITLVILFMVLMYFVSAGKDIKRRFSPYFASIILVLSFEFALVLLDPLVTKITHNNQLYIFIANVLVALLIIPFQGYVAKLLDRFALEIKWKKVEKEA